MLSLILKLLIAHIMGDFVLQPDSWVEEKKNHTYKSKYFYFHGIVHLVFLLILLEFEWSYIPLIVLITTSHLIIDLIKIKLETERNKRVLFILDQLLHLAIIAVVVYIKFPYSLELELVYSTDCLLLTLAILTITSVSSIIMKTIMSKWNLEENHPDNSLENAGKYIGILERLFVLGFILLNQWGAIGLLITAKSVFRFGDLTKAKDRKLTEYVLIGTMLSFGLAISIGILYKHLATQL